MIDATALARHRAIAARASYAAHRREWEGWALSAIKTGPALALPPALRGDFVTEYEQRRDTVTARSIFSKRVDAIRPLDFEARINRILGFKARSGHPTFIYWRHHPIMRLEANGPDPHILISPYHARAERHATRAMFAANNVLDYLMSGVRLTPKGVTVTRRHDITPWPATLNKPAVYIPARGRNRDGLPFWDAATFRFVSVGPLSYAGGESYPPVSPFGGGTALASNDAEQPDDLEGLT